MHAGLGDNLVGPCLEGLGAAVGIARGLPFGTQRSVKLGQLGDAGTQVVFEALELADEYEKLDRIAEACSKAVEDIGAMMEAAR